MSCLIGLFLLLPILTDASFRIIGGGFIDITEAPYQAYLYNEAKNIFCGGAIINKRTIITAAHCVEKVTFPGQMSISVGSNYWRNGKNYKAMEVIPHPNYIERELKNDIAIIVLQNELTFSASVQPLNLPMRGDELEGGTVGIVSGWGATNRETKPGSPLLKYAKVRALSGKNCANFLKNRGLERETVPNSFICTVPENYFKDERSCNGDSGGPFVIKGNIVAGLVSYAFNCGANNTPTFYTKVAYYLDFIKFYSV